MKKNRPFVVQLEATTKVYASVQIAASNLHEAGELARDALKGWSWDHGWWQDARWDTDWQSCEPPTIYAVRPYGPGDKDNG